jgi:hypothetical protein
MLQGGYWKKLESGSWNKRWIEAEIPHNQDALQC